jgi:hypothetical protein
VSGSRRVPGPGQLAFIAVPASAPEVLAAHLDLVRHALEDATSWRAEIDDDDSAAAYQNLIDALDALEDPETDPGEARDRASDT